MADMDLNNRLPSKEYRELLGSSICMFNIVNENLIKILRKWCIGYTDAEIMEDFPIKTIDRFQGYIGGVIGLPLRDLYVEIINMRTLILNSCIVEHNGTYILRSICHNCDNNLITCEFLKKFISHIEEFGKKLEPFLK